MARILIAAAGKEFADMARILGPAHEFVTANDMSKALEMLKVEPLGLLMISVHFDQSRMFDLLRSKQSTSVWTNIPIICFCTRDTQLTRTAHESIDLATKALGAWMYLDYHKYSVSKDSDDELRRIVERCLTDDARKEIQAERVDIHKQREDILRLRQSLAGKEWSIDLEDRVAVLREKLAQVLLELSELQIASIAHQEVVAESDRMEDRVSVPVQCEEEALARDETKIEIQESEQLGKEQQIVPEEETKAKEGRRKLVEVSVP